MMVKFHKKRSGSHLKERKKSNYMQGDHCVLGVSKNHLVVLHLHCLLNGGPLT